MQTPVIQALIAILLSLQVSFAPGSGTGQEPTSPAEPEQNCDFSRVKPLRITSEAERIKRASKPNYPEDAKQQRIEGRVVVKVLVDSEGTVQKACVISGNAMLRKAAEKAAQETIFYPVLINSQKVPFVEETMTFEFKLRAK